MTQVKATLTRAQRLKIIEMSDRVQWVTGENTLKVLVRLGLAEKIDVFRYKLTPAGVERREQLLQRKNL